MPRSVLIAGATGLVGGHLLPRLVADDEVERIVVLARRPPPVEHGKIVLRLTDFDDLATLGELLAVDEVHIALGTTMRAAGSRAAFEHVDLHLVRALAEAAAAAGARRLAMVSSVGASPSSPSFYLRVKGRAEQAVSALAFDAVHILRPGLLLGARRERRSAEALGQRLAPLFAPLLVGSLRRYRPVPAEAVAEAMHRLCGDERLHGRFVHHWPFAHPHHQAGDASSASGQEHGR